MEAEEFFAELRVRARAVSEAIDGGVDILVYSGPIASRTDDELVREIKNKGKHPGCMLLLSTYGGSPDVAYRISRWLQARYFPFIVFVYGDCKSAGTLLAIGADGIILSEYAELGPLDIQLRKPDEPDEASSGLAPIHSMSVLQAQAYETFRGHFLALKQELGLTTRTASTIASELTIGAFREIYGQLDPLKVAEMDRATQIALEYGQRLRAGRHKPNVKDGALERLVFGYPSHSFVIDRNEATELFDVVAEPSKEQERLALHILGATRKPMQETYVRVIETDDPDAENKRTEDPRASAQTGENEPGGGSKGVPS